MSPFLESLAQAAQNTLLQLAGGLPQLLIGLGIFVLGFLLADLVRRAIYRAITRANLGKHGDTLDTVLSQLAFGTILILAGILALSVIGIDVTSLVAGLGLTSLALGFALKDILENTISGLLILFSRSYVVGDIIRVTDQEGVVTDISLRVTTIKTADGIETLIPNRMAYGNILQNRTAFPTLRRMLEFLLPPGQDPVEACARASKATAAIEGMISEPAAQTEAVLTADGQIRLRVHYWVGSRNVPADLGTRVIAAVTAALAHQN